MSTTWRLLYVVLAFSLFSVSCSSSETTVTEVVVELDADPSVAQQLNSLLVEVYDIDQPASAEQPRRVDKASFNLARDGFDVHFPFSLGIAKRKAERFLLVITGYDLAGTLVIEQKAHVRFTDGQSRKAKVQLAEACYEKACSMPGAANWFTSTCHADLPTPCGVVESAATVPVEPVKDDAGSHGELEDSSTIREPAPDGFVQMDDGGAVLARDASLNAPSDGGPMSDSRMPGTPSDGGTSPMQNPPDANRPPAIEDAGPADGGPPIRDAAPDANVPSQIDACYRVVASMAGNPYPVPANQESFPRLKFDAPWGDTQVQALTITPIVDKLAVLRSWRLSGGGALLATWGPGRGVITAPSDVGFYLPSGAMSLILDLSYENLSASVVNDQSGVELCITRTPRSKVAGMLLATYSLINIPPGTTNYSVMGNCIAQVTSPSFIIGAAPIMHGIGTHSRLSLTGGVVLFDAAFTVDNQPWYPVSDKPIQNGEKLLWSCTYSNPSSSAVTLGEGTRNEFCAMAVAYYPRGGVACQESLGGIFGN